MDIIMATIISLVVGLTGTLCGGYIILTRTGSNLRQQSWLLGFSGGVMVVVVVFDLLPESLHFGGVYPMIAGLLMGFMFIQFADPLLQSLSWYKKRGFSRYIKVGILLGMGIGAHNFPEGVALGTTYIAGREVSNWMGLALLMAIHNIPEGMVMASAFKIGNVNIYKIFMALVLVEIPMALGGTAGAFLGKISPLAISMSLGFAGGAMFLLVAKELLPLAKKLAGFFAVSFGFCIGALVGFILVSLI